MGANESVFEKNKDQNKELSTNKSDWVTGHVDMTGCN